jgi:hypothetical protein
MLLNQGVIEMAVIDMTGVGSEYTDAIGGVDPSQWDMGSSLPSFGGATDVGDGGYELSDGSVLSLTEDGVGYTSVLFQNLGDFTKFLNPTESKEVKPSATTKEEEGILDKLSKNPMLTAALVTAGSKMLGGAATAEAAQKLQQDKWGHEAKLLKEKRKLSAYAPITPKIQTGLLGVMQQRKGVTV